MFCSLFLVRKHIELDIKYTRNYYVFLGIIVHSIKNNDFYFTTNYIFSFSV